MIKMFIVNRKLVEEISRSTPDAIKSGKFPGVKLVDTYFVAIAQKTYLEISPSFFRNIFYPHEILPVNKRILVIYHEIGHYFSEYFKRYLKKVDPSSLKELKTGGNHPFVTSRETRNEHGKSWLVTRYIFQSPKDRTGDPVLNHEEAIADAFAAYHYSAGGKNKFKNMYPEAFEWFNEHVKCIDDFKTPVKGLVTIQPSACALK